MDTQQELSGKWRQLAAKVKEKYGQITDSDLTRVNGNIDQLVSLIQQKTGQGREQIQAFFEECGESCESIMGRVSEYASSASETLKDAYDSVAEQTNRGYKASVQTLSQHPLGSFGTAFGIGLVLSPQTSIYRTPLFRFSTQI